MTAEPELERRPQTATKAVLATATTNVALAALAFVAGVLAARMLGPAGRGHLAAAQAMGILVGAIGTLSLAEALVFFVGRRSGRPMVVLQTATLLGGASSAAVITVALLAMPLLLRGEPAAVDAARAYSFFALSLVLLGLPISFVRSLQRFGLWNVLRLIVPSCWLAVLVLFLVTDNRDVETLIVVFLVLQLAFIPVVWVIARRLGQGRGGVDLTLVKPMVRYGTPLFLAALPQTMNVRLDQLFIANLVTAERLGVYAVSVAWASLSLPAMNAIASVLFPKLAAMDLSDAAAVLARAARSATAIGVVGSTATALTAAMLVPLLFGRAFSPPLELPFILGAATAILGLDQLLEEGLRGLGETRTVLLAELAGLAVTVPLLIVLLPRIGITGAAVASLAGYGVVGAVLVWRIRVRAGVRAFQLLIPGPADVRDMVIRARALLPRR